MLLRMLLRDATATPAVAHGDAESVTMQSFCLRCITGICLMCSGPVAKPDGSVPPISC